MTPKEIKEIISKSNATDKDAVLKICLKLEKLFFLHSQIIETLNISKNEYNAEYIDYLIDKKTNNLNIL